MGAFIIIIDSRPILGLRKGIYWHSNNVIITNNLLTDYLTHGNLK